MTVLDVADISVRFGGITALDRASFSIEKNQICGLIGPNGAGKTTLFNVISRIYDPTSGSITFDGNDVLATRPHQISKLGIFRTFQNLALWPGMTVLENVMVGAHSGMSANFVTAPLRFGTRGEERRAAVKSFELLQRLDLADVAFKPAAGMSFGTLKRVEIARALAGDPKLLMLDEPAGGLNHAEVDDLADLIRRLRDEFSLTLLLVEHHMAMVMGISDNVVVLDFGRMIANGPPQQVVNDPMVIEAYLGEQ